ncbi:MAG: hypothetical protein K2L19_02715 [Eubacterium sp.]|nr:hypothetical protein [Eubacterium sp.]
MSPRTGSPKIDNPMNKSIKIRFDDDLFNQIDNYCKNNSITYAQLIREAVKVFLADKK